MGLRPGLHPRLYADERRFWFFFPFRVHRVALVTITSIVDPNLSKHRSGGAQLTSGHMLVG
jgi:hypothetical protein